VVQPESSRTSFIKFLSVRLYIEENNTVSRMSSLLAASTPAEMVNADGPLVELIFDKGAVAECSVSMCDTAKVPDTNVSDYGTNCYKLISCTSVLVLIQQLITCTSVLL
jgi:hypothetical protein